ncbi:MAG: molybdenum cofactor biosynthesis protein MoaE [Gemmatimonadales bacterium]
MMRATMVRHPILSDSLIAEVASESCGATALFLGTVRSSNEGREVGGIEYSAYDEMAEREMGLILEEAGTKFGVEAAVIEHRVGELVPGDVSIGVVVAHHHRAPAMDALRYIVDETKARAPIWKLEHYADGSREWVGAGTSSVT